MVCTLICVAGLTACSTVPSSGPSKQAVLDIGTRPDSPFVIVPISDFVIQKLQHFPGPSLYGKFGDHRGPVEQVIGVGDTVEVTIFEAASNGLFSQAATAGTPGSPSSNGSHSAVFPPQIVQRDGSITIPYAGRVNVVGQTPQAVEKTIVDRLTGKAIEPQAVVTLNRNLSTSVTVTGEVVKGMRVPLTARGDRILDVIATTGGINAPASETFVELTRGGKTTRVPYQTLMADPKENIYARPGDSLVVVRYPLTFTAVGATLRNAVLPFDGLGLSLEEAIGKAAGFVDERADPEGVFVLRYEPIAVVRSYPGLTPQQAALNLVPVAYLINMRDAASLFLARRFSIHDKDIVYVSNSPLSDVTKVANIILSVEAPLVQGAAGYSILRATTGQTANIAPAAAPVATPSVAPAVAP